MAYFDNLEGDFRLYRDWLWLRKEEGAQTAASVEKVANLLRREAARLRRASVPAELSKAEPTDLGAIRRLRPRGPRRLPLDLNGKELGNRILGAWLGRAVGCHMGIPPEGMSKSAIRNAARHFRMKFPIRGYWKADPKPHMPPRSLHYGLTPREKFLERGVDRIGADDDLAYTLLGLLILEEYGPDFTPADVGKAWLAYLPTACTAERVALENLKKGLAPPETARRDNPYTDWIGADIRSDPWGYAAPGWPQMAAEFAWRDAVVSHMAAGVHAAMFFSATIAAAFAVDDPLEAVRIGLTEIPRGCRVARAVKAALRRCRRDGDWDKTTDAILAKYDGMRMPHALNNLELTIAGLYYGDGDFTKTVSLTVSAGIDTDCTAATAGSIMGAILGAGRLPKRLVEPLGDRVESYLVGKKNWKSSAIARRFVRVAGKVAGA